MSGQMTTASEAPALTEDSDVVSKHKAQIADVEAKLAARDEKIIELEGKIAELAEKVTVRENQIAAHGAQRAAQDEQIAARDKKLSAQDAVIAGLSAVDPTEAGRLRADLCATRASIAEEKIRCNNLIRVCENLGLPIPNTDCDPADFAGKEYELSLKNAFQEHVAAAARVHAAALQRDRDDERKSRKEAERVVDCLRLLSGASKFELTADGAKYTVTIANPVTDRKVTFLVAWDENYMDYEPIEVCIPDRDGPSYLKDKIDFRLNQAPKLFSTLLSAVFDDSKKK